MPVKYCEGCGTSVIETMRFCPQCGHRIFSQKPIQPKLTKATANIVARNTKSNSSSNGINYAGFWERFAASLIDNCIVGVACFLIGFVSGVFLTFVGIDVGTQRVQSFYLLSNLAALIVYYAFMESGDKRATFGKQWLELEVTGINYNKISLGQGMGRYFGRWISILLLGIGYLMQPFTPKKQALHDMMSSTLVVKRGEGKSAMTIFICLISSLIVLCLMLAVISIIKHTT